MQVVRLAFRSKNGILLLLLAAVILVFTVSSGGAMLQPLNIRNILQSITIVSLLAIGAGTL
ncbi:MAG: hypothetical protein LBD12_07500, partial [Clostridiales Family XIII bacterium]|nr:hypothetical protein [Clostridiales Family XIII bacterium]